MPKVVVSGPSPDEKGEKSSTGWCCHISIRREYYGGLNDSDEVSLSSTAATPAAAFQRASDRVRKIVGALANQATRDEEREVYED